MCASNHGGVGFDPVPALVCVLSAVPQVSHDAMDGAIGFPMSPESLANSHKPREDGLTHPTDKTKDNIPQQ